jgi:hypothetical protein
MYKIFVGVTLSTITLPILITLLDDLKDIYFRKL